MRLKNKREFDNVYRNGSKIVKLNLVVLYLPSDLRFNRLGVVVSGRVGKSVVRNRIKRLIKEIFRLNRQKLHNNYDIVVIGRKSSARADYITLEKDMLESFRSINRGPNKT